MTTPVAAPTETIDPVALHVPPDVDDARLAVAPTQIAVLPPVMAAGSGFTVTIVDSEQPIGPIA